MSQHRLIRAWNTFFFDTYDPVALALFRITIGIFILIMLIALSPNWETYYGLGGVRPEPAGYGGWSLFIWTQSVVSVTVYWWIGIVAAVSLTLGWNSRICAAILFILQSSMNHANPMVVNGEDLVLRMLLFLAVFSPLGHRFSIDQFLRMERKQATRLSTPLWPVRLMQINIVLVYAFSLPNKLLADISWLNGEAIYWVMMTSTWNRWPLHDLFYNDMVSKLITYSTVLIEGSFPFLIWFKKTRPLILGAIALFHLGLAILLQHVTFFSFSMLISFILFVPDDVILLRILKPLSTIIRNIRISVRTLHSD